MNWILNRGSKSIEPVKQQNSFLLLEKSGRGAGISSNLEGEEEREGEAEGGAFGLIP